ncbi:Uncharacterised protein [Haemophilus influenzae]|uniref:Uncharacterized protein n=1 Tax=Haemophilus influenzae TaxID=727 RepID=A0A2X1PQ29_HAEIF|nr:Uncharacterised protein [Haemophilus influenzae]
MAFNNGVFSFTSFVIIKLLDIQLDCLARSAEYGILLYANRYDAIEVQLGDNIRWHKGSEDLINSLLGDRIFQDDPL